MRSVIAPPGSRGPLPVLVLSQARRQASSSKGGGRNVQKSLRARKLVEWADNELARVIVYEYPLLID